jgi:hypothetical protein
MPFLAPNVTTHQCCEDAEELIQDGTALAAKMMHNAEQAGKKLVQSSKNNRRNQGEEGKPVTAGNVRGGHPLVP